MRIRHTTLIITVLGVALASAAASAADVSLPPDADSWIELGDSDDISANHGSDTTLSIGRFSIFSDFGILIRFDLSGIPAGSTINDATLRLFEGTMAYGPPNDLFELFTISEAWDEATVSGQSAPSTNDPPTCVPSSANAVIDITGFVDDWINNGVANHGILIQNTGFNHSGNFVSREGARSLPMLDVSFTSGPPCPEDTNDDGMVDVTDLLAVLGACGPCTGCAADINDDDAVDVTDLLAVLGAWAPCN